MRGITQLLFVVLASLQLGVNGRIGSIYNPKNRDDMTTKAARIDGALWGHVDFIERE
jgi:hypothetical protein